MTVFCFEIGQLTNKEGDIMGCWCCPSPEEPPITATGFSAQLIPSSISSSKQLKNWKTIHPFYTGIGFNPITGNYTVPETGRYAIKAVISYQTTAAISASLGGGINPSFVIRKTQPTTTDLISGLFPVLNVNILFLLTLRAVLGNGEITLVGDVALTAGDVIGVYYVASGLTINLNIGAGTPSGTIWSVHRIA